ncbi:MAG: hypothetical protein ACJ8BW_33295 [Ktedonobacteraceae bacterium]
MNLRKQGLPTLRVPTVLDQSQRTGARPLGDHGPCGGIGFVSA